MACLGCLAICFGVLTVLYPIVAISKSQYGFNEIVVNIYYGFFTLFFLGMVIGQKHLFEYCGFVKSLWIKSLFYVFCASLAFANIHLWICWLMGCIMSVGAILNMIRCIGGHNDVNINK